MGTTEAITASLLSVLEEGDKVLITVPAYPSYQPMIDLGGAELIILDISEPDFICQPKQLEQAFEAYRRIRAFLGE